MSAAWVAGSVRARAIARRRVGAAGARDLAGSGSLPVAVDMLARSPYGRRVHPGDELAGAKRGVAATLLWNLRVLAGWLPPHGAEMLRVVAGWFEIANAEEHIRALHGQPAADPYQLGTLATAWPRIAATTSADELRTVLASSPWGDPGAANPRSVQLSMRLSWAERVAGRIPAARTWTCAAAALVVARESLARGMALPEAAAAAASRLLGARAAIAQSLTDLRSALPAAARWVLDDISDVSQLWRAEIRWWGHLRADSARLVTRSGFGPERVIGAIGLLAFDAWIVDGALEVAARGHEALEVFDALA
jgi:hypothetical protein